MEHSNQHNHQHGKSDKQAEDHQHHHAPTKTDNNNSSKGNDDHSGHDKHSGHHTHDFLKRFWICLILTIPVLLLSHMVQDWLNFNIRFQGDKYVLLALGTIIYFYGGMPFLKGLVTEIRNKAIGMMTLVALAITVAFVYSVAIVFGLPGMDFFWELATLIYIML